MVGSELATTVSLVVGAGEVGIIIITMAAGAGVEEGVGEGAGLMTGGTDCQRVITQHEEEQKLDSCI